MNLERFFRDRQPQWAELEGLVADSGRRPERLGPDRVRRLGALYRGAAADLALARRRFPTDPVVARLEDLVSRARHLVYDAVGARPSLVHFVRTGYWRLIAERPGMLAIAALALLGPLAAAAAWAAADPAVAAEVVPGTYRSVTEPRVAGDLGISADQQAQLSAAIFTNNIRVAFLAFAGGATAGLLTGALLVFNGGFIGVIAGLAFEAGNGRPFTELVIAHGVLELSCIVVAGLAGLRLGWAIVAPGHRPRGEVVRGEARAGAGLALGTAVWLVVAGLVEGFVTPAGAGLATVTTLGVALGALFWTLVVWRGRVAPQTRALALAPR